MSDNQNRNENFEEDKNLDFLLQKFYDGNQSDEIEEIPDKPPEIIGRRPEGVFEPAPERSFPAEEPPEPDEMPVSRTNGAQDIKDMPQQDHDRLFELLGNRDKQRPARYKFEEYEDEQLEMRDYHPIRPRRDGKTGCLGGIMYAVFVISLSVILACVGWMCASDVLALNKDEASAVVTIGKYSGEPVIVTNEDGEREELTPNVDIDEVAGALKDAGIIEYTFLFKLFAKISDAEYKIEPGSYELSTSFDYRALVKKMQIGSTSQLVTTLTFPEGYTMEEIFAKLEENEVCSKERLYEAAANYTFSFSFLEGAEKGDPSRLEGFLFPDTYDFYQGEQASSVINKFLLNFYYKRTADMLAQAETLNMSMHQIVIVASMIEKETGIASERADVASVIYNRLNSGMKLQIDATVQYALGERKPYLTQADLEVDSPYNTYLYEGLPVGAISNPGIESIKAALMPNTTNYLYYALDTATGEHQFFSSYQSFESFTATQDYESYFNQ